MEVSFVRRPSAPRYMLEAFARGRPQGPFPPLVARWSGHRIADRELERFLELTGLPRGETLPSVAPLTFGFRLHMVLLTSRRAPVPIWNVLQVRNHVTQHRPIPRTASLDFETRVAGQRGLEKGAEVDLQTFVRVGGELYWESVVTFLVRGLRGIAPLPSSFAASPDAPTEEVASFTMADGHGREFGSFTGDYNGIHLWDAYARRFGFRRALYHPSRVVGQCLARLPPLPDAHRLDVWLKGPVYRGAAVSLRSDGDRFALFTRDDPRPSVIGRIR